MMYLICSDMVLFDLPQFAAGNLTDPPMSDPRPKGEPQAAIIAPSPPVLPPARHLRQ